MPGCGVRSLIPPLLRLTQHLQCKTHLFCTFNRIFSTWMAERYTVLSVFSLFLPKDYSSFFFQVCNRALWIQERQPCADQAYLSLNVSLVVHFGHSEDVETGIVSRTWGLSSFAAGGTSAEPDVWPWIFVDATQDFVIVPASVRMAFVFFYLFVFPQPIPTFASLFGFLSILPSFRDWPHCNLGTSILC